MSRAALAWLLFLELAACSSPATLSPGDLAPITSNVPAETPPAGTAPGYLLALDAKTGKVLWQVHAPMGAVSQPAASDGRVFVQGGYDCRGETAVLAAFRASDGSARQAPTATDPTKSVTCAVALPPAAMPGVVISLEPAAPAGVTASGNPELPITVVHGLEPQSGRQLWTATGLEPLATSGPLLMWVKSAGGTYALAAIDPANGKPRWQVDVYGMNGPLLANDRVAMTTGFTGPSTPQASGVDLATGNTLWQYALGQGYLGSMAISDVAAIMFTPEVELAPPESAPATLVVLDSVSGVELWQKTAGKGGLDLVGAAQGTVYSASSTTLPATTCPSVISAWDSQSGNLRWATEVIAGCSSAVAVDVSMLVLANSTLTSSGVAAYDATSGSKLWERQLPQPAVCRDECFPPIHATIAGGVVYLGGRSLHREPGGRRLKWLLRSAARWQ